MRALAAEETPEAYEGLGTAARYLLDAEEATTSHERGYRLARERDDAAAARLAVQLAYDSFTFRGAAEATGWIERAGALVEGRPPSAASSFVLYARAYLALMAEHDPVRACDGAVAAGRSARDVGAVDVEMLALALEGLSRVCVGEITEGMRALDTATAAAVGGEIIDADSIETVCCLMIDACKRVRDLERAGEWCVRVRDIATRFGDRGMFAVCRTHYADVLLWHGDWGAADDELVAAARELGRLRPGKDEDALVRLAELRRRQGAVQEAEELLARAPTHSLTPLVSGRLAIERGDADEASASAERFLRRVGGEDRFERIGGLELLVRACIAGGDLPAAREAAQEIAATADTLVGSPLRAAALLAEGRVAAASADPGRARESLEDAADLYDRAGARYEAAHARLELAALERAVGRERRARRLEVPARAALVELGAAAPAVPSHPLSPRETEVLRLIAQGLSNEDIARRLVLSVRTVERHAANVYDKIGASGRTARAVATAWAYERGIA